MDGGFENRLSYVCYNGEEAVRKIYTRAERFLAEWKALQLCEHLGITPRILAISIKNKTIFLSKVDGEPIDFLKLTQRDSLACAENLAHSLRLLHSCRADSTGDLGKEPCGTWDSYLRLKIQIRLRELPLSVDHTTKLEAYLHKNLSQLAFQAEYSLLQHDLKPANLLRNDQNRVKIIDFDQAKIGDPLSDLGKLRWRTFEQTDSILWRTFCTCYFGKDNADQESTSAIDFYEIMHCLGALAYWHSYGIQNYIMHAKSAQSRIEHCTGIKVPL